MQTFLERQEKFEAETKDKINFLEEALSMQDGDDSQLNESIEDVGEINDEVKSVRSQGSYQGL